MDVKLVKYRLSELLSLGDARRDSDAFVQYGDPKKLAVFAANPFRRGEDSATRVVLMVDGAVAGGEYVYPLEIVADGKIVKCGSGSETSIKEEYRKSAVGLEFLSGEGPLEESTHVSLGCGMAQRYARIHKMFGYKIFPMPRFMAVFHSHSVVEMYAPRVLVKTLSAILDCGLLLWWKLVALYGTWCLRHYEIREVKPDETGVLARIAELTMSDGMRFKENHCVEWFRWHLTQALHEEGPSRLYAMTKAGVVVGFFMTKRRFHAQASSRGFKNVMLGSVIEWGVESELQKMLVPAVLAAVLQLRREKVDAVEVATSDTALIGGLRRSLMRPVGESNFGIRVGGRSVLAEVPGWDDPANWRLRPAMCDNGL